MASVPADAAITSVDSTTPASAASCSDRELPSIIRDEPDAPSDAVISSFFSTMIELVSFDDENTGLSGLPALSNGIGTSLQEHHSMSHVAS